MAGQTQWRDMVVRPGPLPLRRMSAVSTTEVLLASEDRVLLRTYPHCRGGTFAITRGLDTGWAAGIDAVPPAGGEHRTAPADFCFRRNGDRGWSAPIAWKREASVARLRPPTSAIRANESLRPPAIHDNQREFRHSCLNSAAIRAIPKTMRRDEIPRPCRYFWEWS
jgi:hypothetical protein